MLRGALTRLACAPQRGGEFEGAAGAICPLPGIKTRAKRFAALLGTQVVAVCAASAAGLMLALRWKTLSGS